MKKKFLLLLTGLLCLWAALSVAEISTNLRTVTVKDKAGRNVLSVTYVDAEGNAVIADDKGYAALHYTYGTGNVVTREERLDAEGNLINGRDGYAYLVNKYSLQKLIERTYYDAAGNVVPGPEGYARLTQTWTAGKLLDGTTYYDADLQVMEPHRVYEYDGKRQIRDAWLDGEGNLAMGPEGYAALEHEYNGTREISIQYLDDQGNLVHNEKAKYAKLLNEYGVGGKLVSTSWFGAGDQLIAGPNGYAQVRYSYPEDNTRVEMYYNADGTEYLTNKGYCGFLRRTDVKNRTLEQIYYVSEGVQGYCQEGYSRTVLSWYSVGLHSQKYYDDANQLMIMPQLGYAWVENTYYGKRLSRTVYYGTDNQPILNVDHIAGIRYVYANRRVSERIYLDTDLKTPVNCALGYATTAYAYDENGKVASETHYTAEGEPFVAEGGEDETRTEWDGNLKISESYWRGNVPVLGEKGYHEVCYAYNGGGKQTRVSFYDTEGNLTLSTDGYAAQATEYNSRGDACARWYYGAEGELIPAPGKDYACERTLSFQDLETMTAQAVHIPREEGATGSVVEYYGTDGQLMMLPAGYAYVVRQLDENGKLREEAFYDAEGNPAVIDRGYHRMTRVNDAAGNPLTQSFWGAEGEPVASSDGYHRIERTWLNGNHVTSEAWFDEQDQPIPHGNTFVRVEREFDEAGNTAVERYYDAEGALTPCKDGYDEIHRFYNERNWQIRVEWYLGGAPLVRSDGYAALEQDYDENKRVIRERYYGADFQPILRNKGYAVLERVLDEAGNVASEWYLGTEGEPVLSTDGFHRIDRSWLDSKHVSSEAWFDTEGIPMTRGNTYVRIEREFDDAGNTAVERYYGPEGNQIPCRDGYDEIHRVFNEKNWEIRVEWYLGGAPLVRSDGYAAREQDYDDEKRVIRERYYGADFQPILNKKGFAAWDRVYDDQGRVTEESYFSTAGKPVLREEGYAAFQREYDAEGNITAEWYLGTDREPILMNGNYARVERTWLDSKHKLSEAWFDAEGKPIAPKDRYVKITWEYDAWGNRISEKYWDAEGNPTACNAGYREINWIFDPPEEEEEAQ